MYRKRNNKVPRLSILFPISFVFVSIILIPNLTLSEGLRCPLKQDTVDVEEIIRHMTIQQKLGQMFIVGFEGDTVTNIIENLIRKYFVGGVILFDRNVRFQRSDCSYSEYPRANDDRPPKHVAELTNNLQDLASKTPYKIPLFIAADQENGKITVIEKGVTIFPGNMSLGYSRSEAFAFGAGKVTAEELRAMGVNMNLAPVVDVHTNIKNDIIGVRSFGGNTEIVSRLGTQFMKGLHQGGVIAVGKHFPGHGDTDVDPHNDLPKIQFDITHIEQSMLPPFDSLIQNDIGAIMTAHMEVPALNTQKSLPVSLSADVLKKVLRNTLGFRGVIVTDDLTEMGAIKGSTDRAVELAFDAGNDIIILAHFPTAKFNLNTFDSLFKRLIDKYENDHSIIDSSVKRILLQKLRINDSLDASAWKVNKEELNNLLRKRSSLDLAQEIANSSIVLVTEGGNTVSKLENSPGFSGKYAPLKEISVDDSILLISSVFYPPDLLYEELRNKEKHAVRCIRLIYRYGDDTIVGEKIWEEKIPEWYNSSGTINVEAIDRKVKEIVDASKNSRLIIFSVVKKEHVDILRRLANQIPEKQIIVVALSEPYIVDEDLLGRENITLLATACAAEPSIKALVRVLYGDLKPKPIANLSVSIMGRVDIRRNIGAPIISIHAIDDDGNIKEILYIIGVGLICLGASLAGATVKVLSSQTITSWWLDRKEDGTLVLGFGIQVILFAIWGIISFLILLIVMNIFSQQPIVSNIEKVPGYIYILAGMAGFIGGFIGSSILKSIPIIKKCV